MEVGRHSGVCLLLLKSVCYFCRVAADGDRQDIQQRRSHRAKNKPGLLSSGDQRKEGPGLPGFIVLLVA